MVYHSAFFALVVLFALDRMKIPECIITTIPTTANGSVGFTSRPINQLRPFGLFHFCVFRNHKGIMTKLRNFDNKKCKR
jgi:hypothetical protein